MHIGSPSSSCWAVDVRAPGSLSFWLAWALDVPRTVAQPSQAHQAEQGFSRYQLTKEPSLPLQHWVFYFFFLEILLLWHSCCPMAQVRRGARKLPGMLALCGPA